jgi:hypothetical protein
VSLGLVVFLAGLFGVPLVLLQGSHALRKRSPRYRAVFWGAVIGHCVAAVMAVAFAMFPPEAWTSEDTMRGFAGLWSLLLLPAAGALIGALAPRGRGTARSLVLGLAAAGTLLAAQSRGSLRPVIGDWSVIEDEGPALKVDGGAWNGETSDVDLRFAAKALFPSVEQSFVTHGMSAGAFPLAVWSEAAGFGSGTIKVRFKLLGGKTDQNAGIVFGLEPGGNYHFLRYNTKDGNLAVWAYAAGERTVLTHGETHLQLPLDTWHELVVTVNGAEVRGSVTGTPLTVEHKFESPLTGRIGVWTKRDAITAFRDFSAAAAR